MDLVLKEPELLQLIAVGESEQIEFKESFGDEALETVGAFANTHGGTLLIGVKDNGKINGTQIGKKTLEDLANRILESTDPRVQPSITKASCQGHSLIILQITPSSGAPVSVRGRYFCRIGRTNQRMGHQEIMRRMTAATGISWDAVLVPDTTLADLDAEQLKHFIQAIKAKGRLPVPDNASPIDVLRKLKLIKNDTLTRAALLLFNKNPDDWFPSAFLKIGRFRSPTLIVNDLEAHGPLMEQVESATNWFREKFETEFIITGNPQREVLWEYPLKAVREAIINVVCHRDYTSAAHSQIRLHDDRLEIWNAGGLPSSLTLEELFQEHDSVPRNPKIAEAFFVAGFIERWGSGTVSIAEELENAGLTKPKFESHSGKFRLTLFKKQRAASLMTVDLSSSTEYSSSREIRILQILAAENFLSLQTIIDRLGQEDSSVASRTIRDNLTRLKKHGHISSKGRGRGSVWFLNHTDAGIRRNKAE